MNKSPEQKHELAELVDTIRSSAGCRTDIDQLLQKLESATGYSEVGTLIFCPPDGRELTATEIVEISLQRSTHR